MKKNCPQSVVAELQLQRINRVSSSKKFETLSKLHTNQARVKKNGRSLSNLSNRYLEGKMSLEV